MKKKKKLLQRLLLCVLSVLMVINTWTVSVFAEDAGNVIINKIYGSSTDGYASSGFIELYNPTAETVDLSGWSLQYRSSADGSDNAGWVKLDLTGTISGNDYYLVRCAAVTDMTNVKVTVPEGNQEWDITLHNKGLSAALMNNQTLLDASVQGDLSGALPAGLVDLAAASGNDYTGGGEADANAAQLAPAYLGSDFAAAAGLQSKKKGISRTDFADTKNTKADFTAVDYSKSVTEEQLPHVGTAAEPAPVPFKAETLTLAPGNDTTELYVTWYADSTVTKAQVEFSGSKAVEAVITPASDGKVSCRAVVTGLIPGQSYTYHVIEDGVSSEDYKYNCPAAGSFSFGYVGDPQINMTKYDANNNWGGTSTSEGWQASVTEMMKAGVAFIASVGDNTDTTKGNEAEYTAFFAPEELRTLPYAPTVGNHDRNVMFTYHFSYPNAVDFAGSNPTASSGDTAVTETKANYYYLYNNALFIVINDSAYPSSKEQAQVFIDTFRNTLKAGTEKFSGQYDWLFVQHHKSTESVANHVSDSDIKYYVEAGFEKLMDEYKVDFVMAGHDHVYARSYILKDGQRVNTVSSEVYENPEGTLYLTANTASGLKYYALANADAGKTEYPYLADGSTGMANYGPDNLAIGVDKWDQANRPGYTIVSVNGSSVTFDSYCVGGAEKIDSVTVKKAETEPEPTEPETTAPETTEPETTAPETTEPETTAPETTEPETTAPETTAPETTEPETTEPETTVPETTEADTAGSQTNGTGVSSANGNGPDTGDSVNLAGYLTVMAIAVIAIGSICIRRKKHI